MKKPVKILLILHLPPPIHGASVVGEMILESNLINKAFHCTYINLSASKDLNQIGKLSFSKMFVFLSLYLKVFRALVLSRYSFCYVTINSKGSPFYKDFGIVLLLKLFRQKILYHFHNKGVSLYNHKFMDNLMYRITFHQTHLILLSRLLYFDVERYLPLERVFFCPNGIASTTLPPLEPAAGKPCQLLFLSNMMKAKGVWDLISACEVLKNRGLDFTCNFVGKWFDISESSFSEMVKEKELENFVFSHGAQYGESKQRYMAEADIFVFPSHDEAFPLVLLEAMQYGLPVISTKIGAIPEIIDDRVNGMLVEPTDVSDLAEKIELLINNPALRKEYGVIAQNKFRASYTREMFEENLHSIFSQVLA